VRENVLRVQGVWNREYGVSFCPSCGGYFLPEVPGPAEMAAYYKNEYYKNVEGRLVSAVKTLFREFRSESQAAFVSPLLEGRGAVSLLEVGAGDGCLISRFSSKADRLVGLEHNSRYFQRAQKKYGIKLRSDDFFDLEEPFDLILMSHVFEHFPDIDRVAAHFKKLLKPNGMVFIEVPHSPHPDECSKEFLQHYVNTTHTFNFTPQALSAFFERQDFRILKWGRFYYRIRDSISRATQQAVGRLFLEGGGGSLRTLLPAVEYVTTHIFNKKNSFKEVNSKGMFQGFGDNIRMVVALNTGPEGSPSLHS
jgi:2-polyprenyl-3-methyl-5-hydroxy-6-metoxy-1,4-benzoquinol methylase